MGSPNTRGSRPRWRMWAAAESPWGPAPMSATGASSSERLIEELRPDVALVDVKMPVLGGVELCERLAERGTPTRVVMISAYLDPNLVARALRAGAAGYLGKDASREEICEALVDVGRRVVAAQVP